ncbi:MAG: hypothetical protein ACXWBS_11410 [Chthoniobacterales bacterium]
MIEKINPMGWTAELNDKARFAQFPGGFYSRNPIVPKFEQRVKESRNICSRVFVEEIDIAGDARIAMEDNSLSADDEIPDAISCEQTQEAEDVLGESSVSYRARWHSRTSLALAG